VISRLGTGKSITFFYSVFLCCRAVRQAMKSRESPDVQDAILAVHLGLIDEAENILAGKKRVTFALIVLIF
jgi:hypothetical protein